MPIIAYILANVRTGKEYEVIDAIRKMEGIVEVTLTYGLWDLVAKVETNSMSDLDRIVTSIRRIEGVEQTATLVGV